MRCWEGGRRKNVHNFFSRGGDASAPLVPPPGRASSARANRARCFLLKKRIGQGNKLRPRRHPMGCCGSKQAQIHVVPPPESARLPPGARRAAAARELLRHGKWFVLYDRVPTGPKRK